MAAGGAQRNPWIGCVLSHHPAPQGRGDIRAGHVHTIAVSRRLQHQAPRQPDCARVAGAPIRLSRRDRPRRTVSTGCAALHLWQSAAGPSGRRVVGGGPCPRVALRSTRGKAPAALRGGGLLGGGPCPRVALRSTRGKSPPPLRDGDLLGRGPCPRVALRSTRGKSPPPLRGGDLLGGGPCPRVALRCTRGKAPPALRGGDLLGGGPCPRVALRSTRGKSPLSLRGRSQHTSVPWTPPNPSCTLMDHSKVGPGLVCPGRTLQLPDSRARRPRYPLTVRLGSLRLRSGQAGQAGGRPYVGRKPIPQKTAGAGPGRYISAGARTGQSPILERIGHPRRYVCKAGALHYPGSAGGAAGSVVGGLDFACMNEASVSTGMGNTSVVLCSAPTSTSVCR